MKTYKTTFILILTLMLYQATLAQSEPTKQETFDFLKLMIDKTAPNRADWFRDEISFQSYDLNKNILTIKSHTKYFGDYRGEPDNIQIYTLNLTYFKEARFYDDTDDDDEDYRKYNLACRCTYEATKGDDSIWFYFNKVEDCKRMKKAFEHAKKLIDKENEGSSFFDD